MPEVGPSDWSESAFIAALIIEKYLFNIPSSIEHTHDLADHLSGDKIRCEVKRLATASLPEFHHAPSPQVESRQLP
jgi:hypothetical protein